MLVILVTYLTYSKLSNKKESTERKNSMSYTELYAVNKQGDVEFYGEVRNSFAGAMHVWNTLSKKYRLNDNLFNEFKKTWNNYNKDFYEAYEDVVLGSTFDSVLVKKENFTELIEAFEEYTTYHNGSNLLQQVEFIEKAKDDEDIIAIGWCQTSVANDMWDWEWIEEEEEETLIPYNIYKGTQHWFLFEDLKTTKEKEGSQ